MGDFMKQKRILPFLLAAALLLGLTGCGDSSDSSSLPEEEPENLDPDSDKSEGDIIDEITGQMKLF